MITNSEGDIQYFQAEAITDFVQRFVHKNHVRSILDIGAGSPNTACKISSTVPRYQAIEGNVDRYFRLIDAGVNALYGTFPLKISGQFDLVLSSHSIPEEGMHLYPPFLKAAWANVSCGGTLQIITFKGCGGAVKSLRQTLTRRSTNESRERDLIMEILGCLGSVSVESFDSHCYGSTVEGMASFLGPWIAVNRSAALEANLMEEIKCRLETGDGRYLIATQHLVISCKKAGRMLAI